MLNKKKKYARPDIKPERFGADTNTDPQGSYTGKPANPRERPVQDADDL